MAKTNAYTAPSAVAAQAFLDNAKFNDQGLIAVIAQQYDSREVLMQAWMNRTALEETLTTGRMVYWSRSRTSLWRKGESSGQTQQVIDLRLDCDGDSLLALVHQEGVACHTGRRSCYFYALRDDAITAIAPVIADPDELYGSSKS